MAYNNQYTATLFLLSLILFTSTTPQAHAIGIITLPGLSVTGSLCCTPTGNCPGQGVAGVNVALNCTILGLLTTTVGQGITNANGTFNITVPALPGVILNLPLAPCVVGVQLPLGAVVCPVLSTTNAVLSSAVQAVGTFVTAAFGLVQNATAVGFVRLGQ